MMIVVLRSPPGRYGVAVGAGETGVSVTVGVGEGVVSGVAGVPDGVAPPAGASPDAGTGGSIVTGASKSDSIVVNFVRICPACGWLSPPIFVTPIFRSGLT